ncbi:uncharacterized protein LOC131604843 [Vicia villosa]|uniref:uncharacterized protein LOC131604843 n=1 Tax=Vicia villosa TaxID=3911 RepID=UPI00273C9D10|nr:uncharacterized protein LOC131604843 [Vicia villosa]
MDDRLEDMMRDTGQDSFKRAHAYDSLCIDKDKLYPGCTNFTRLSTVLKFFNLKEINGWTDKSFTELLELLTQMLLEGNILPSRYYEAKKILCPMGLEYEKIHACPNDCILYRKEYVSYNHCLKCKASRYKKRHGESSDDEEVKKGPPAEVVWHLPIISRFERLFSNADDAKNLRWHAEERKCDGQIRRVADSLQWKEIDSLFPNFGKESRNLRLGLSIDGMNPFGNLNTNHSSWPVLLMIYNLSPRLCMKRKYVMLSMMSSDSRQPGNDIDVYLSPLIDDLKVLWEEGVDVFDAHSGEQFNVCAMLFCTIKDFLAYGNLSWYNVKGHKACSICEKDTCYHQHEKGKKTVYLGHQKFLNRYHPYRRLRKAFNEEQEHGVAPKPLTGEQVYQRQQGITVVFGKYQKRSIVKNIWKKRSVFFDLPYWSSLEVDSSDHVANVDMCIDKYMDDSTDNPFSSSKPNKRRVRGPTLMIQIDKFHQTGEKIKVEFDLRTYEYYCVKDKDGKIKDPLKKEWIKYAGERWRGFKTEITNGYVNNPKKDLTPAHVRKKVEKGRENVARNVYPHDSLVEEDEKGVFVPHGCNDILTAAIRKSEHGGRVSGVGIE